MGDSRPIGEQDPARVLAGLQANGGPGQRTDIGVVRRHSALRAGERDAGRRLRTRVWRRYQIVGDEVLHRSLSSSPSSSRQHPDQRFFV